MNRLPSRIRTRLRTGLLAAALGVNWRGEAAAGPAPGEVEACRMALGRAD